jgi:hypothetical protein
MKRINDTWHWIKKFEIGTGKDAIAECGESSDIKKNITLTGSNYIVQVTCQKCRELYEQQNREIAVTFMDFCEGKSLEEIKMALKFYNEKFEIEKIFQYFVGWEKVSGDGRYVILKSHNKEHGWKTQLDINDEAEYMIAEQENCWINYPATIGEFISDMLRYEDILLIFSIVAINKIYGEKNQ